MSDTNKYAAALIGQYVYGNPTVDELGSHLSAFPSFAGLALVPLAAYLFLAGRARDEDQLSIRRALWLGGDLVVRSMLVFSGFIAVHAYFVFERFTSLFLATILVGFLLTAAAGIVLTLPCAWIVSRRRPPESA